MHLLSTRPGGYVDDGGQGIVRVSQSPADIVVLSAADTTLALLSDAVQRLPADFPTVRLANLMWLRQPASTDFYVDDVLRHARVVVLDHLGAPSDWAYLVEQIELLARRHGQWVAVFSGDQVQDPQLVMRSTASPDACHQLWRYLREGGRDNADGFLGYIAHAVWGRGECPPPARSLDLVSEYHPELDLNGFDAINKIGVNAPTALVVFYRAHLQAGNTAVFDALLQALADQGVRPLAVAVDSLKNPDNLAALSAMVRAQRVDLVLNATAFAIGSPDGPADSTASPAHHWAGDAPVLQLITAGCDRGQWQADPHGLNPRDLAMQVVLPEVDGRIVTRAISFKGLAWRCERTQTEVVRYQPEPDRIAFVAELTRRWCHLRHAPVADKRVALILANYPGDDARVANGVGLDTPASTVDILHALQAQGWHTGGPTQPLPADSDALMARLLADVTNDLAQNDHRGVGQSLAMADYLADFARLSPDNQTAVCDLWGQPEADPMVRAGRFMVSGQRWGHVFVGIQPSRGRDMDGVVGYHDADLVPPHAYLAFYFWLRREFQVDAVVHVGKHGNLEWLPGKSVALGADCWPDLLLGPVPHLYPFIVNDPGEGSQAKRRTQAVIIDHLMPALTRAETYGPLLELERQMDEYVEALSLDPLRAGRLRKDILAHVLQHRLHEDLGFVEPKTDDQREALLNRLDGYLCELKESQIRDGLHCFGTSPQNGQRTDTLVALSRFGSGAAVGQGSLLKALAHDLGLGAFDPLTPDWAHPWQGPRPAVLQAASDHAWRHQGHTRERLEQLARVLIDGSQPAQAAWVQTLAVLSHLRQVLAPRVDACGQAEMQGLLQGLAGRFVPPGPSGAPSRGRPDVLPTGRNFYSVDTRAVPTLSAYQTGSLAAERVIERHLQDHGCFPASVGLSVWGTSTMRTGGEDMAQAFALLGVRPKWAPGSNRVTDIEVLPMAIRNRPRVDVTLRVSGFFRDAFPTLIDLFDAAVQAVAAISAEDEPDDVNPIRVRVQREAAQAHAQGMDPEQAQRQATWRVFGPRLGGYGAGVQEQIVAGRWQGSDELAQSYLAVGGFAYGQDGHGVTARAAFEQRVGGLDAVLHNQDNREHDILDSDDYYQFQGGMGAAVQLLSGALPALYHGDLSVPGAPRIRTLSEEVARVVRSRVVNPKWIAGIQRHGYKGAFELAATVEYLFGFDATVGVVTDHQYAMVADAYVYNDDTREFMAQHNPQALRSVGERLLEAMQRGLWEAPGDHRERIAQHLLALDEQLEAAGDDQPLP